MFGSLVVFICYCDHGEYVDRSTGMNLFVQTPSFEMDIDSKNLLLYANLFDYDEHHYKSCFC